MKILCIIREGAREFLAVAVVMLLILALAMTTMAISSVFVFALGCIVGEGLCMELRLAWSARKLMYPASCESTRDQGSPCERTALTGEEAKVLPDHRSMEMHSI